jgi:hypothetical protein
VQGIDRDRWEGYAEQRARLLDHITDNGIRGVLFVSGDLHQTSLNRVEATGPRATILETMAGPGGSFLNLAGRLLPEDEQWLYSDAEWSAHRITCHVDGTAHIEVVSEDAGIILDATVDVDGNVLSIEKVHPWQLE